MDEEITLLEFSAVDRCDGCGARAHACARRDDMVELLFCMHHLRESYQNLLDEGWEVIEDTEAVEMLSIAQYSAPV